MHQRPTSKELSKRREKRTDRNAKGSATTSFEFRRKAVKKGCRRK